MMMKTATLMTLAYGAPADGSVLDIEDSRRYSQLMAWMTSYNPTFDERKYWTYGCHCLMLGDRPMTQPGKGAPIDALDSVCKSYKDCLKCAREKHGEMCIGEFVEYSFNINKQKCRNDGGTCERALCECDAAFAMNHVGVKDVYNNDYHMFWSTTGWNMDTECVSSSGGAVDPKCCSTDTSAASIFNAYTKECCANGTVKPIGQC
ncbi:unnamed protein product [Oikopleura dioica]|uniref:Phospholipase A2-like central domain-containing protein n=1 Tax=Oikopleura dioica TaxID=34765 RepID=E4Y954_OIKDI|nr:unnamed protein product [Oikopleura dioica]